MDAGFPPDQPAHVIGQVSQSDFRGGPGDPDGAHDQPEAALLGRKHRLNSRAHPRAGSVGPSLHGGEAEPRSAAEVNLRDEAVLLQKRLVGFRAVGRIGPDRAGGVRLVQNRPKLSPVVGCCVRDREPPHEAVGSIDADVVLVAKHRDGNLDPPLPRGLGGGLGPGPLQGPAGIPILLGQPLGLVLPASWAGPASLLGWSCQPSGMWPALIACCSASVLRCLGQTTMEASTIGPDMARYPSAFRAASTVANKPSIAPARVSCSRKSQTVLASGTGCSSPSPRKRMNERRSRI